MEVVAWGEEVGEKVEENWVVEVWVKVVVGWGEEVKEMVVMGSVEEVRERVVVDWAGKGVMG